MGNHKEVRMPWHYYFSVLFFAGVGSGEMGEKTQAWFTRVNCFSSSLHHPADINYSLMVVFQGRVSDHLLALQTSK